MRAKALLMRREGLQIDLPPVHVANVRYTPGGPHNAARHTVELREGRALGRSKDGRPTFSYSLQTFLRILKHAPERFTPDHRLRPLLQAWSLPVAAFIPGPHDLTAHVLAEEAYELLNLTPPVIFLAQRFLLLPDRVQELMNEYEVSLAEIWSGLESKRNQLIATTDRLNIAAREHHLKHELRRAFNEAAAGLETLDPALSREASELTEELQLSVARFFNDVRELHRRGNTRIINDFRTMENWLRPQAEVQWQVFSALPFLAAHGLSVLSELLHLPPNPLPQLVLLRDSRV
jgi:uncharacterized protein YllA (UPF0747 family)